MLNNIFLRHTSISWLFTCSMVRRSYNVVTMLRPFLACIKIYFHYLLTFYLYKVYLWQIVITMLIFFKRWIKCYLKGLMYTIQKKTNLLKKEFFIWKYTDFKGLDCKPRTSVYVFFTLLILYLTIYELFRLSTLSWRCYKKRSNCLFCKPKTYWLSVDEFFKPDLFFFH